MPAAVLPMDDEANAIYYQHAGSMPLVRRFFLSKLRRVGRRRFVAVPNRLFPVEHHTCLSVIHHLPKSIFRRLLRGTRYDAWSHEENLNYVSASGLLDLWPAERPAIAYSGIGIGPFRSNLIAYNA